jgi:glycosyltransferase involved in cell wall biosynthesis
VIPTLSVILPTTGRDTLDRTLHSIYSQEGEYGLDVVKILDDPPHYDWGCWARNTALGQADGDILVFIDDDDVFLPGAFAAVLREVEEDPDAVHIFRMARGEPFNDVLWRTRDIESPGQVSTQMFAVPNRPALLGSWTPAYTGDFDFIHETARNFGRVAWHETVIACWRPN